MKIPAKLLLMAMASLMGGCETSISLLTDKAREEHLLKPGALDRQLTYVYDQYQYKFLNQYRISHDWLRNSNGCKYAQLATRGAKTGAESELFIADDIVEIGDNTLQVDGDERHSIDHHVREPRLAPMCFQAWVGTNHTLILRLHKRDLDTWKRQWSKYNPAGIWSEQKIGNVTWSVLENSEENMDPTDRVGGWYKSWIAPIGDTGYGISVQLGATKDSLRFPAAHANFKKIFRHIVESVRIDPLTPQVEAEIQQAKRAAFDLSKKECLDRKRRNQKPYPWCGD